LSTDDRISEGKRCQSRSTVSMRQNINRRPGARGRRLEDVARLIGMAHTLRLQPGRREVSKQRARRVSSSTAVQHVRFDFEWPLGHPGLPRVAAFLFQHNAHEAAFLSGTGIRYIEQRLKRSALLAAQSARRSPLSSAWASYPPLSVPGASCARSLAAESGYWSAAAAADPVLLRPG
jgi:hypothetical protein